MNAAVLNHVNLKTNNVEIEKPSALPKDYKSFAESYLGELSSPLHLPMSLREKVAIITAKSHQSAKNEIYILFVSIEPSAASFARKFISACKDNANRLNIDCLNVVKCTPDNTVIPHLNEQIKNLTSVKASSRTDQDVKFTEEILLDAFLRNASDVHVESQGGGLALVRARINKELNVIRWITQKEAETFANVCYGTFTSNLEEKGTAKGVYKASSLLEGIFQRKIRDPLTNKEHYIKGRMVNLSHNEDSNADFIIRLIDKNKNNKAKRFIEMGFSPHATSMLRRLEGISSGAILTCGVTNSGKSTSQQNMLQHERDRSNGKRKIISMEDPVEYDLELITQITINAPKEGTSDDNNFTFDNINKKTMRSDPDTLSYGEIRDDITTRAMIKGAMSGHLVYGTIHTDGVMQVFERLHDFGASMSDVCREGFLRLVLFQHLLPKICPHCSTAYQIGQPIPEKYDELFVAQLHMKQQKKSDDKTLHRLQKEAVESNTSLFRVMQRNGIINSSTVKELREKKFMLNEAGDTEAFRGRLEKIIRMSLHDKETINIRFKGHGCENCVDGLIGICPAAEILIPDNTFLELMKSGQKTKAKLYWRTMLSGRTAAEDCYDRIFDGAIDPRAVEEHLGNLGD